MQLRRRLGRSGLSGLNLPRHGNHVQPAPGRGVARGGQLPVPLEADADVLPLGVPLRVEVVLDVSGLGRVDGVVPPHGAVLAGEPFRAALPVDDVARDHVLLAGLLRAETFAGGVAGGGVRGTLGGVGGMSEEGEREEWEGGCCRRLWDGECGGRRPLEEGLRLRCGGQEGGREGSFEHPEGCP